LTTYSKRNTFGPSSSFAQATPQTASLRPVGPSGRPSGLWLDGPDALGELRDRARNDVVLQRVGRELIEVGFSILLRPAGTDIFIDDVSLQHQEETAPPPYYSLTERLGRKHGDSAIPDFMDSIKRRAE
jgi:hypothetical protein